MSGGDDGPQLMAQGSTEAVPASAVPTSPASEVGNVVDSEPSPASLAPPEDLSASSGRPLSSPLAIQSSAATEPASQSNWRFLKGSWPALVAGVPALVTLVALMFSLFPWLEPAPPPEVRSVTITQLVLGERNKALDDGRVANSVFFEVETVGYDAENIAVDWLVYDAVTQERLDEPEIPVRWGVIDIGTRSDRVVGEIEVPPPADHVGCVFVRVFLTPFLRAGQTPETVDSRLLLDVADTDAFDPYDPTNDRCPDSPAANSESS
jgi:hypothetical protein